jgi:hypothetical protein
LADPAHDLAYLLGSRQILLLERDAQRLLGVSNRRGALAEQRARLGRIDEAVNPNVRIFHVSEGLDEGRDELRRGRFVACGGNPSSRAEHPCVVHHDRHVRGLVCQLERIVEPAAVEYQRKESGGRPRSSGS